jgi:hypothetical protein
MNNNNIITFLCLFLFFLCSCGAVERCPKNDVCHIQFINQSVSNIFVGESVYLPDTSLQKVDFRLTSNIKPNSDYPLSTTAGWKNKIKTYCMSTKIMFVVINRDTVDKYGIDDVKANYRIEKRYELSIDSLEKLSWTITYP